MTAAAAPAEFLPDSDGNARVVLHGGDSRELVKGLASGSIDAVVCDPPYALVSIVKRFGKKGAAPAKGNEAYARASAGFMGKQWDTGEVAFDPDFWADVLRAMKPGAHLVAFSGTRSYHRLACAIEDAGFEIRDSVLDMIASDDPVLRFLNSLSEEQAEAFLRCVDESTFGGMLAWVYGSGFPKSHDVAKAIDKRLGVKGETAAQGTALKRMIPGADQHRNGWTKDNGREYQPGEYLPGSEEAAAWQGWGTALKPAWEPIVLARKPVARDAGGTVAGNVLEHGAGALNIDGARVPMSDDDAAYIAERLGGFNNTKSIGGADSGILGGGKVVDRQVAYDASKGRWPANIVHDGSEEVLAGFPQADGFSGGGRREGLGRDGVTFNSLADGGDVKFYGDSGTAARFFYTAKADADDRLGSKHPTVKPVDLMQWLVRLLCPKGGTVLDPFAGTGTTGEAAWREGCRAVLFEREAEYRADIARRMELALAPPRVRKAEIAARKGLRGKGADLVIDDDIGLFGDELPSAAPEQGVGAEQSGRSD